MRIDGTTRIAWRNLGRNKRRTALMLGAIAVAQMSVLMMDGLMNGWMDKTVDALTGPLTGHVQVHAPSWRDERAPDLTIDDLEANLRSVRALDGVSAAYARIYAPALVAREIDGQAALVIGVDVPLESEVGGLLEGLAVEGRPEGRDVLVGATFARDAGIEVGDELALLGQGADGSMANDLLIVRGLLSTPVDMINRMGVVMELGSAQEVFAMPDQAHEITVRGLESPAEAEALAQRVASVEGVGEYEVLPWRELSPELAQFLEIGGAYSMVVLFIVFLAAAVGVMNTMLMSTFERRRELGMLLSLGTSPRRMIRMVLTEAVILGWLGVLLGSFIGSGIVAWWGHTGLSMVLSSEEDVADMALYGVSFSGHLYPYLELADFLPGFIGIVVVSIAAAFWPALATARLEPIEAMRS